MEQTDARTHARTPVHEMTYGEKRSCCTAATSGLTRRYMYQTKSPYPGFSSLKSHPDSVIGSSRKQCMNVRLCVNREIHYSSNSIFRHFRSVCRRNGCRCLSISTALVLYPLLSPTASLNICCIATTNTSLQRISQFYGTDVGRTVLQTSSPHWLFISFFADVTVTLTSD